MVRNSFISNFFLFFLFTAFSSCLYSQDTIIVVRLKRKISFNPHLKSYRISGDTIYENRKKTSQADRFKLNQWQYDKQYCIFIDKKNRKIMEGVWWSESMLKQITIFHKNGQIKSIGECYHKFCGEWSFYSKKGRLKRVKNYSSCD